MFPIQSLGVECKVCLSRRGGGGGGAGGSKVRKPILVIVESAIAR